MSTMESEQDARTHVMGAGDSQMNLANVRASTPTNIQYAYFPSPRIRRCT